jgi:hypothetical protein
VRRNVYDYRDCLRREFVFQCGYCLSREREVGPAEPFGGFEIDHHRPESRFKAFIYRYDNLIWACRLCNRAKRDAWPTRDEERNGIVFLDPVRDPLGKHLVIEDTTVTVLNESRPGHYFVETIHLNSQAHRERRRRRAVFEMMFRNLGLELDKVEAGSAEAESLRKELQTIQSEVLEPTPWDAPERCRCATSSTT